MNTTHQTTLRRTRSTRRGITLVEMMVAMALSLGIMLILTQAFRISLDFVRVANANGTMMNHLSGAGNLLEHDLSAEHFLPEPGKPNGGVKLSDQRVAAARPRGGFFRIVSRTPTYHAPDGEGNALSTATDHQLHFTSIFKGGSDSERFLGISPAGSGNVYKSAAGEVAWFLVPTGEFTSAGPGRLPLHNLVRRYRLAAIDDDSRSALQQAVASDNAATTGPTHHEVISVPNPGGQVNTLADLTNPANRFQLPLTALPPNSPAQYQPGSVRYGEDVVLTNVLSFEVLVWWDGGVANRAGGRPYSPFPGNTEAPYDHMQSLGGVFDTSLGAAPGTTSTVGSRVRGLQFTIRVCDMRVGIARQNTWKIAL